MIEEALWNAYYRELDLKNENARLLKKIENLEKALEKNIVLVRKNTFNCKTWECEYVDRYYFNGEQKNIEVKYDEELDKPKTAYERVCMEEAGILEKGDN